MVSWGKGWRTLLERMQLPLVVAFCTTQLAPASGHACAMLHYGSDIRSAAEPCTPLSRKSVQTTKYNMAPCPRGSNLPWNDARCSGKCPSTGFGKEEAGRTCAHGIK